MQQCTKHYRSTYTTVDTYTGDSLKQGRGRVIRRAGVILSILFCLQAFEPVVAQRSCANAVSEGPSVMTIADKPSAPQVPSIITIPVVVHVVYNINQQNISNEQIISQLDVLNADYRKRNADTVNIPAAFKNIAADARIEFKLAGIDPDGLPTSGIIRKKTTVASFGLDDAIKSSASGGSDPWDHNDYLNIWVGNLADGIMGYASAPGSVPEKDGVVIRYNVFGTTANVKSPFNRGRTAVHEIGHWLGLRHIWGDAPCGDDLIDDTPPQPGPTRGCPTGVATTCSGASTGGMYMNFMDFTNDACTNMFTHGQVQRMRQQFSNEGPRSGLLLSTKAMVNGKELLDAPSADAFVIYPNPARDRLGITFTSAGVSTREVVVYNQLGQVIRQVKLSNNTVELNIGNLKPGIYFLSTGKGSKVQKFIKAD